MPNPNQNPNRGTLPGSPNSAPAFPIPAVPSDLPSMLPSGANSVDTLISASQAAAAPAIDVAQLAKELAAFQQTKDPAAMSEFERLSIAEMRLRVEALEEAAALKKQKAAQLKEQRIQGASTIKKRMAEVARQQRSCSHTKENGKTALAGQRDHSQNVIMECQFCHKTYRMGPTWTNDEQYDPIAHPGSVHPRGLPYSDPVPQHLWPKAEMIGGPQVG